MKICVIGNSHVGVVKTAYDAIPPSVNKPEITFFADRGRRVVDLIVQDGVLCAASSNANLKAAISFTSGGLTQIDPEHYDRLLLIGLSTGIERLLPMLGRPISQSARNRALRDFWEVKEVTEMCKKLRGITDRPISFGLTPLPAAHKSNDVGPEGYEQMIALSQVLHFDEMDVTMVGQPRNTIVNGHSTEYALSKGSTRLQVHQKLGVEEHPEGEFHHMNATYGSLWLENYFAKTGITF